MQQNLADLEACAPSTAASTDIHQQDSRWNASDTHHPCQSSAGSEPKHTQPASLVTTTPPCHKCLCIFGPKGAI